MGHRSTGPAQATSEREMMQEVHTHADVPMVSKLQQAVEKVISTPSEINKEAKGMPGFAENEFRKYYK
jgi:hypothetical protein